MSVSVPVEHPLVDKQDWPPYPGKAIAKDTKIAAIRGAMYAYGKAGRRVLFQCYNVDLGGVNTPTVIARAAITIAALREEGDLKIAWYATNADIDVLIRDAADTLTYASTSFSETTAADGSKVLTYASTAHAEVQIKVQGESLGAGAQLAYLQVWEEGHDAVSLPS